MTMSTRQAEHLRPRNNLLSEEMAQLKTKLIRIHLVALQEGNKEIITLRIIRRTAEWRYNTEVSCQDKEQSN